MSRGSSGSWSRLGHHLRVGGIALAASWITVTCWRVLTEDFAEVGVPLLMIGATLAAVGAVARWRHVPALLIIATQLILGALFVLGTTTGVPLPTPERVEQFRGALVDAITSAQTYAAPIQSDVPPVHPLLLVGGVLIVVMVDAIGATLRRAPVAGIVLLAAYTLPVAVTGEAVSWWVFVAAASLYLALVFMQHSEHVSRWGRGAEAEGGSFSVRTGAIANTALSLGAASIAVAVVTPSAIPTMSMSVFDGNGPGTREVEVRDPMVDLRRDLSRGEDRPLLWVTTSGPRPTYLRTSVLARFTGSQWTPGDREIPESQAADGELPPLDGVSVSLPRKEFEYDVRVAPDFASTWLPTAGQTTRISAGADWRYDLTTRDVIAAQEDITTAGMTYDYTGVQLTYDAASMDASVSGAGNVAGIFTQVPPELNNQIRRLAASVTADAPTRFQKAQALQSWFREEGGFRYDLSQVPSSGDGAADLLAFLNDRVGYCEQFAASMAIMARVLGIPSRVAVGFLEPEQSTNGTWEFSSHDFHAWPELYFPGSGWVRFEPTPQARAAGTPSYTQAQFDDVTQTPSPSVAPSSELLPERGEQPEATTDTSQSDGSSIPWVPVLSSLAGLVVLGLLLAAPRLVRSARRQRRLSGDLEDVWAELRDLVRDLGHAWPLGRSPRRIGDALGRLLAQPVAGPDRPDRPRTGRDQAPESSAALDRLVAAWERSRYARSPEMFTAEQVADDLALVEASLMAGATPRAVRLARWWPASVIGAERRGRRTGSRTARASARTTPPRTGPAGSTNTSVDELVG